MTTIYLIRHAEADGNLYRIAQGQDNSTLTPRGWKQVALLQERFAPIHIDAVYSSDLYRTCATASAIFEAKNLPLHPDEQLREIHVGPWERHTWGDIAREYPQELHNFTFNAQDYHLEGGETLLEVQDRLRHAIAGIAAAHPGETVAVFSHGYAIRLLLAYLQGYSLADFDKTPTGDNTAVSCLEAEGDTLRVRFRDDATHLAQLNQGKKRTNAVEPGLYFRPSDPAEIATALGATVEGDGFILARQVDDTPVGYLQLEAGKILDLGLLPAMRNKGYGAQLLGQAVMACRALGLDAVQLSTAKVQEDIAPFLTRYDFQPVGDVLEKSIAFDSRYLFS